MTEIKFTCQRVKVKFKVPRPIQDIGLGDGPSTAHRIAVVQNELLLGLGFEDKNRQVIHLICFNWSEVAEYVAENIDTPPELS